MPRVFISYVRENWNVVRELVEVLKARDLDVWIDREQLLPGQRWASVIREAIRNGDYFIACFSRESSEKTKSFMNDEISVAIEELRKRPHDKAWFLPVRLNECKIPDLSIGAGETLSSIHYVDLFADHDFGINRLVASVARGPSYDRARDATIAPDISESSQRNRESSLLAEFSRDLTQAARDGQLEQPVGRETELVTVIEILCHRTSNNPLLVGEHGVGKTAIVDGLVHRMADGRVPPLLAGKRILELDISQIVKGTKYRGEFEERLKNIMKELIESQNAIIFIDELHLLVGAGSADGSLDAASILKPGLSHGIQCIGATTPAEYRKSIERDRSLERRFKVVRVPPPNEADAIRILFGIKERYEKFHEVSYTDEAIKVSVAYSNRYLPDRYLPGRAVEVLDRAGARVKLRQTSVSEEFNEAQKRIALIVDRMEKANANHEFAKALSYSDEEHKERENLRALREKYFLDESAAGIVSRKDIEDVVSLLTGIPVAFIREEESQKLLRIEEELHKRVISQHQAVTAVARAVRRSRAGFKSPNHPIGSFLFLGPTGVGKTEVARTLAEFMYGSEKSLVRFDMSEFMDRHSVSKLIGAPPGYVGYEEGGQLTERVKRAPYSVVLLDKIEKAHPDLVGVLEEVFEDGKLTDALGNIVDFKNVIIIMTSNVGARFLQKRTGLGFPEDDEIISTKVEQSVQNEMRRAFDPGFLNRLDEIIIFNSLTERDLIQIVELMVQQLNTRLGERSITITVTEEARNWILDQTMTESRYGARPLHRALQKYIESPISEALIRGAFAQRPTSLEVYLDNGQLSYRPMG
jgi:ATP-dependent Clp protease ATP-binding subunit ClpC